MVEATALIVTAFGLRLLTLKNCSALPSPTGCVELNVSAAGKNVIAVVELIPEPEMLIVLGPPLPVSVSVSVAVREPVAVGANVR